MQQDREILRHCDRYMVFIKVVKLLQAIFSKIKHDKVWTGKSLGYYLLCMSLLQLGYQLWVRISGSVDQGWSRFGFRVFFSLCLDILSLGDAALRPVYYLSVLWLFGLAVAMILKRLPLKTYIAGEILLGLPSAFFLRRSDSDSLHAHLVIVAVFLFESAIPVVWATVLVWLRWKSRPPKVRVIPIRQTKALGYYLLSVSLSQVVVLFAQYVFPERFSNLATMLQARYGVYVFLQIIDSAQDGPDLPIYFWPAIWLSGLTLAVLMICGRQPLKTYMLTEVLLGIPGALFVAIIFLSGEWTSDYPLWERLVGTTVFLLVTPFPLCWTCWLLWLKRRIPRGKSGLPVSTSGASLNTV
jgi:hypothetical protein